MGNLFPNAIDPDGRDVILLNDFNGAGYAGHLALLIGNDKDGWRYVSKEGTDYYVLGTVNLLTEENSKQKFDNLNEFLNSKYNEDHHKKGMRRYESGVVFKTTSKQDEKIFADAKKYASTWYDLSGHFSTQCVQTAIYPLVENGLLPSYFRYLSRIPNLAYGGFPNFWLSPTRGFIQLYDMSFFSFLNFNQLDYNIKEDAWLFNPRF